jgi:hypothetical protein
MDEATLNKMIAAWRIEWLKAIDEMLRPPPSVQG